MKFLQEGSVKSMCKSVPVWDKETPFENVNFCYTCVSGSNRCFVNNVVRSPEASMDFGLVHPVYYCCSATGLEKTAGKYVVSSAYTALMVVPANGGWYSWHISISFCWGSRSTVGQNKSRTIKESSWIETGGTDLNLDHDTAWYFFLFFCRNDINDKYNINGHKSLEHTVLWARQTQNIE